MNISEKVPKTEQTKSNHAFTYLSDEDDTIDLLESLKYLWKRKYFIIVFTLVAFLGSFSYSFLQPLVYKTETIIVTLENNDFHVTNEQAAQILKEVNDDKIELFLEMFEKLKYNLIFSSLQNVFINTEGVKELLDSERNMGINDKNILSGLLNKLAVNNIEKLKYNLVSGTLQNEFINTESVKELLDSERNLGTIDKNIVSGIKINNNRIILVSNHPEIAAKLLNYYVKYIESITSKKLVYNVNKSMTKKINQTEKLIKIETGRINNQREYQNKLREKAIIEYEEAILIASKLGIKEYNIKLFSNSVQNFPLYMRGSRALLAELDVLLNNQQEYQINLREKAIIEYEEAILIASKLGIKEYNIKLFSNSPHHFPLYMRGSRALNAELDVLRNRKYRFISNEDLTKLFDELNYLRSIKNEVELTHLKIVQDPSSTKTTSMTKNYKIIPLVTLMGLFFGIMLTFFIEFVHKIIKPLEKAEKDN